MALARYVFPMLPPVLTADKGGLATLWRVSFPNPGERLRAVNFQNQ